MNTTLDMSRRIAGRWVAIALGSLAAAAVRAEDRVVVPLTDASRPALLDVDTFRTAVNVHAYDGKEVVIVARENPVGQSDPSTIVATIDSVTAHARAFWRSLYHFGTVDDCLARKCLNLQAPLMLSLGSDRHQLL